jgi:two-component system chemotaxis response regulator CheY
MLDKTVLVVDDSLITRNLLTRILKSIGFARVLDAKNGVEAWDRVTASGEPIGLILLDWTMPLMNGVQFLQKLRAHPSARRIPVVMVSAESSPQRVCEAMQAGARSYVMKPFHPNELKVKIVEAIRVAEIGEPRAALSGSLSEIGLPALVQLCAAVALTGRVTIRANGRPIAEVGMEAGEVRSCAYQDRAGDEAFLALAIERDGAFEFVAGDPPVERNVNGPTMALVMEAMRRQDELLRAA